MGLTDRVLSANSVHCVLIIKLIGKALCVLALTVDLATLSGCNAFSFADSPSGDSQILSAARACFDAGNYTCAGTYYGQLSSASSDQGTSETAFEVLAQNGLTSAVFMNAILSGTITGGKLVTKMSNAISSNSTATQSARLAILHSYQAASTISETRLKGLVQFMTALTLAAEILAESASKAGTLKQSDLVTNPTLCLSSPILGCTAPSSLLPTGSTSIGALQNATDAQFTGSANLYMLNSAISALDQGLTNMQTTGSLGTSTSTFTQILLVSAQLLVANSDSPGYRAVLISQSIGE